MTQPRAATDRARRHVVVVDNSRVARSIGSRIRRARLRSGLTQRELAGDRYTAAYISALETGSAKPSMASLHYLSERLSVPVRALIGEDPSDWDALQADLRLAAGDWQHAADLYESLLARDVGAVERRSVLLGLAETLCRLDRGRQALPIASEAHELAERSGDEAAAAQAAYWMAAAHSQLDNVEASRALLADVLAHVRAGLKITGDFRFRVLVAMAMTESQDDEHERALAYLEEARALSGELDDLRRARYLFNMAVEYQQVGDYEGSLRAAIQSAVLFRAAESQRELAALENTTALTYLQMGNPTRAEEALQRATELIGSQPDDRFAPHLAETRARIAIAQERFDEAANWLAVAVATARTAGNSRTLASALRTQASLELQLGHQDAALATYEEAAKAARGHGGRALVRNVLADWAQALTAAGRLEDATALYREALSQG